MAENITHIETKNKEVKVNKRERHQRVQSRFMFQKAIIETMQEKKY